jgi:hypothetical protein
MDMPDSLPSILLVIAAAVLVLFLPGAAILAWERSARRDPLEWAAEAVGLSMAVTALAAAGLFWLNIQVNAIGLGFLYVAALAGWLIPRLRSRRVWHVSAAGLGAAAVVLALVAWRLFQARTLALPAWTDPIQHTLLVRLIIQHGGLPPDWMPYLPVPMYYHFGFHVLAASFTTWSQLELTQSLLVFGQVINALVALSVYRLAKVLWGDWRRAILATLLVGFAFHMPAYYLTWGRYTLLAGLALLPLAVATALEMHRGRRTPAAMVQLVLYTAGICFTHYLVTLLLALFFACLGVAEAVNMVRSRNLKEARWQPFAGALLGVFVSLPWLLRVWNYGQGMASVDLANPFDPAQSQGLLDTMNYILYLIGPLRNDVLLALSGLGLILALVRRARQPGVVVTAAWALLLAFFSTPYAPRFNPFRPDLVAIVLFLPAALFLPDLVWTLGEWLSCIPWRHAARAALAFALLASAGLVGWGLIETRDILNPVTILAGQADLDALHWIGANTPQSARFFINSTFWQGSLYRGTDGGYWIMPATGRFDVVAPLAISFGPADEIARYEGWAERASKVKACDASFWSLVQDASLNYVYVRDGAGSLTAATLDMCQKIEKVYSQQGVTIYKINQNAP